MSALENVAIAGASGALGQPILDGIVSSGKFNVTVLSRTGSSSKFPSSVTVKDVDYTSVEALTAALKGQDAVVSAIGAPGLSDQNKLVDAALAAGVKRFLPSEFGSDLDNPQTITFPIFGHKVATQKYVEEKAQANPNFTFTLVRNGAFLDWGLENAFLFDWKSDSPRIYDSGDQLFSTTTLASVGSAVVGVLIHPEETKNRAVYVQDLQTSQNRILAIARQLAPHRKWTPVHTSTAEIKKAADAKAAAGDFSYGVLVEYIFPAIFGEGTGGRFEKTDNELLGVAGDKTDEDVKAILKPLLAK